MKGGSAELAETTPVLPAPAGNSAGTSAATSAPSTQFVPSVASTDGTPVPPTPEPEAPGSDQKAVIGGGDRLAAANSVTPVTLGGSAGTRTFSAKVEPMTEMSEQEPLPATPGPTTPSTDQKACTTDDQFFVAKDGSSDTLALVNRHVLCVRQIHEREVDLKNSEGVTIWRSGKVSLDARWSVHGVHNKLQKTGTLVLSYKYEKYNELPAPTLRVAVKIACSSNNPTVKCSKSGTEVSLTSGAPGKSQNISIPISWNTADEKIVRTTIGVKLLYTTDGSAPMQTQDGSGNTYTVDTHFGSWSLRCDIDQLRSKWKGCVFPDAAAVWNPVEDASTQQARDHIKHVFATMPDLPGRFKMKPGQRSQASEEFRPLIRTDDQYAIERNRAAAVSRCSTIVEPTLPRCAAGNCDCDEYPPASTLQGAYNKSYAEYSVRKILDSDNRKAGAQMGAMYAKERVLKNDEFWIKVD